MKIRITVAILATLASACGSDVQTSSGACANSVLNGSWEGSVLGQTDVVTFSEDCSFSSTLCQTVGSVPHAASGSGTLLVTVTSTNGASGCLTAGQHSCTYSISGSELSYGCGSGTVQYTKK